MVARAVVPDITLPIWVKIFACRDGVPPRR
jgi:hypothetical protein